MRYLIVGILLIVITGCVSIYKPKKAINSKNEQYKILYNEGTICLNKLNKTTLKVGYFPLNSSCKSSSAVSWKMNSLEPKVNGNRIVIESYSLYKLTHSPIATADCAGAGQQVKTIKILANNQDIYWGKVNIANLKTLNHKACFKKVGKRVSPRSSSIIKF